MEAPSDRLKIAVQKSGRLTEHTMDLLERCGLKIRKSKDQLFCYGENMPIDLLLVRILRPQRSSRSIVCSVRRPDFCTAILRRSEAASMGTLVLLNGGRAQRDAARALT